MRFMKQAFLLPLILVLAFLGIADSWYLTESAYRGIPLTCGIESLDGCNEVAESPYSSVAGIPLSLIGVVFYSLIFAVAGGLLVAFDWRLLSLLRTFSVLGALASVGFVLVQVFLISALCIYCLISALLSIAIFWAVGKLPRGSNVREPVVVPWGAS